MRPPLAGPSQTASVCSVSPRKFSWREHGRLVRSAFALWRGHASRETSRNGLRLAARGVRRAQLHAMAQDTSEYVMREDRLGPGVTATVFRRRGRVDVEVDLSAPRPGAGGREVLSLLCFHIGTLSGIEIPIRR